MSPLHRAAPARNRNEGDIPKGRRWRTEGIRRGMQRTRYETERLKRERKQNPRGQAAGGGGARVLQASCLPTWSGLGEVTLGSEENL